MHIVLLENGDCRVQKLEMAALAATIPSSYPKTFFPLNTEHRLFTHLAVVETAWKQQWDSVLIVESTAPFSFRFQELDDWAHKTQFDVGVLSPVPDEVLQNNRLTHGHVPLVYLVKQDYFVPFLHLFLPYIHRGIDGMAHHRLPVGEVWIRYPVPDPDPVPVFVGFKDKECGFYCLSHQSSERAQQMKRRFQQCGLELHVHDGAKIDDVRLRPVVDIPDLRRLWSCTYGHLDNLRRFVASDYRYGFLCEDDVMISRYLANHLSCLVVDFETMELEVMLLGYMLTSAPPPSSSIFGNPEKLGYGYYRYPSDLWGMHLVLFSKPYAQRLLAQFAEDYACESLKDKRMIPFSPDWLFTKDAPGDKRAMRFPMLAVEDGNGQYDDEGQARYHRASHEFNYDPDIFV